MSDLPEHANLRRTLSKISPEFSLRVEWDADAVGEVVALEVLDTRSPKAYRGCRYLLESPKAAKAAERCIVEAAKEMLR